MFNWRNLSWKHLFVMLLLLHILPLWIFAYFPSQDGASHVYNGLVLKEYGKHENYQMRNAWELNITIFPNWLSHIFLLAFLYVFPPVIAEKVFLTIAIGTVPFAFLYFFNAVHKDENGKLPVYAWLGFPFTLNYLLYMGFYNFQLSISFFFFSFGFWWKHKDDMQVQHLIWLYVLLLLTYLSHIASYGLVVLGISIAGGCLSGVPAVAAAWRTRGKGFTTLLQKFVVSLKPVFRFFLYMVPMYFVLIDYYLQSVKQHKQGNHRGMEWVWEYFWGVKSIVYFDDWHVKANYFLLAVLAIAVIISIGYRIHRKEWVKRTDAFLLIAFLLTYMFVRAPWSYGPGGWINDRIHIYILPMLAAWLIPNMGKFPRYAVAGCLVFFSLLHFGRTAYDHARIAPEIAELVSGTHLIEPHTTYQIRSEDWHKSDALGKVEYVTPFVHHMALYGVYAKDVAHLSNYEAAFNYFPVNRNDENAPDDYLDLWYHKAPVDYVVAWYPPDTAEFRAYTADHEIIHETKHLQLYRKKRAAGPVLELWNKTEEGNLIIRFDMQPNGSATALDHHAIGPNTEYESGKFGWHTRSPHEAYQGDSRETQLAQDGVWGQRDAAFKLDLPNGTYHVTNTFCTAGDRTHTINLLANGTQVLEDFTISADGEVLQHTYTIEVTEGYLTQVIFTPKDRVRPEADWNNKNHFWIWNGCTVEQIQPK
ncbi:hypothetical protein C6500_17980 [Candidatus Poribacteria bacterium]|nr:MAG: hypothetical protein C6500_17980 [Candidatus Poribacteria bacterium]